MNEYLTYTWWVSLSIVSVLNIYVYLNKLWYATDRSDYARRMRILAGPYVMACAFRSFLPRIDAERICLVDHPFSSIFSGRSAATIAELTFFAQLCLATSKLANDLRGYNKQSATLITIVDLSCWVSFFGIVAAECFSWRGVITMNQYWQIWEETLWLVCSLILFACCVALLVAWRSINRTLDVKSKSNTASAKAAWTFLIGYVLLCPFYALYMYFVDIPMYRDRYLHSVATNFKFLSIQDGLISTLSCQYATQDFAVWLPETYWMTPYFTACVWASIWLMKAPAFRPSAITKSPSPPSVGSKHTSKKKK